MHSVRSAHFALLALARLKNIRVMEGNRKKEKYGRPPLGDKKRQSRIAASFTTAEKTSIEAKAKLARISPSEFLYRAALQREVAEPTPAVNLQAVKELNAIGKNLNLLLKTTYGKQQFDVQTVEKYFKILLEIKSEVRRGKN
jgi:hypothetical protein